MADFVPVHVTYTNHRGETRLRHILPIRLWYGKTIYHLVDQPLLEAKDLEDDRVKDFALSGFHRWPGPAGG